MKSRVLLLALSIQSTCVYPAPFWWETVKHPMQVGALFECSAAVGNELIRFIKAHHGPRRILELGAGKGAITRIICQSLRADDHLDVIEINSCYCAELSKKFNQLIFPNVHIHCIDALSFKPNTFYDFIICTIPLTTMDNDNLALLLNHLKVLAHPGTYCSYVQYRFLFTARRYMTYGVNRRLLAQREAMIEKFKKQYFVKTVSIIKNVPPIYVHHLKF